MSRKVTMDDCMVMAEAIQEITKLQARVKELEEENALLKPASEHEIVDFGFATTGFYQKPTSTKEAGSEAI